jgi:hypothetical protein
VSLDDDVLAALEWSLAAPDQDLVNAVTIEVNRCVPFWRRVSPDRVASLVGAALFVRDTRGLDPADPVALAEVVRQSGLRGRHIPQLAWKVARTLRAIEEMNSR